MQTEGAGKPLGPSPPHGWPPSEMPGTAPQPSLSTSPLLCPGSRPSGQPPTPSANLKGNKYKLYKVKGGPMLPWAGPGGGRGGDPAARASHHP